jgi:hypothetical protein
VSARIDPEKKIALQVATSGLAVLTGCSAAADGESTPVEPVTDMPDRAHHRAIGNVPTMEESLREKGINIVDVPPALSMVEMRADPKLLAAQEVRVPRKTLRVGMGEKHPREDVGALQEILKELGFHPKKAKTNGVFGPRFKRSVIELQDTLRIMGRPTETNGVFGERTSRSLAKLYETRKGRKALKAAHADLREYRRYAPGAHYPAHSQRAKDLFRAAARTAGLPESWATSRGLHNILENESDGRVGIPNYTYGSRRDTVREWKQIHRELRAGRITAESTATGLGQLLNYNVDAYYPRGAKGIGVPLEEAIGMLRYIEAAYGNPENAWVKYNTEHEGY